MKRKILGMTLALMGMSAGAAEWRIYDQVATPPNAAMICHLWGVTIFAPDEKPSCMIGTLYTVDLETREIRYQNATEQGLPRTRDGRELNRTTLINAMNGNGVEKLESLRTAFVAEREQARAKAEAEKVRVDYLAAYEGATTLQRITEFETKYAANDPDELISKLAATKERLAKEQYRTAYTAAMTSAELSQFIADYSSNDPDKLVPEAKKRLPLVKKKEQLAQQQAEKKRQEALRQQEQAAKQATAEKDRYRLQYIQKLHAKYAGNLIAESPEALRIVTRFKVDCRVPDGRALPLINALYASIAQMDGVGARLVFHLQSRGQQVRIYANAYKGGKPLGEPSLYYQINEWGELKPVALRSEAVLNACIGSQGPIWVMPGELGY